MWMDGMVHYRLLPGVFPKGMDFHFDGLATVMSFRFQGGELQISTVYYESDAEEDYSKCFFFGSGTTHLGGKLCFKNPAVNLLPLDGQLWLTIDTFAWGRVDPLTLATLPGKPAVDALTLNAHPACDPVSGECFVQHPCPQKKSPVGKDVCWSKIVTGPEDLTLIEYSRAELKGEKILQHSHSPCITPNFLVSKMDSFSLQTPKVQDGGLLEFAHQSADNQWLVMDRRTNESRIMISNMAFVNNHFWNCFERDGNVVVDTITATEHYLDNYFRSALSKPSTPWTDLFFPAQRCLVPSTGSSIACTPFAQDTSLIFDYPTFNPLWKTEPTYQYFYAIAPHIDAEVSDRWFSRVLKMDAQTGAVLLEWSAPNVFVTEADFVPRTITEGKGTEDAGVLLTVIYNATSDTSALVVLNASDMKLLDSYALPEVVPFHAHGIHCRSAREGGKCFPNP